MFCDVVGGLVGSPERRVLGHASSLDHVAMVVHQVAVLAAVEHLSRPSVLLVDVALRLQPPEVEQDGLEEPVVNDGKTQVLHVLLEFRESYVVASY